MLGFALEGNIVDIVNKVIYQGEIRVENGRIESIVPNLETYDNYIMPGFVDSHIHIESSMIRPSEFAREAVKFGTVATVSDPHEIANVLGMAGIKYMIDDGNSIPFKFFFGAPSCVPATEFETAGAKITVQDIEVLFDKYGFKYLSEMMNYPGVIYDDPDVLEKLRVSIKRGLPIDGHAPELSGKDLEKYIKSGIGTDHESITLSNAIDKIFLGMKIMIREGSAAKNFDELYKLIEARPEMVMLCSDDLHPDDLVKGHINLLVKKALAKGVGLMNILRAVTLNPINHYKLDVGCLQVGDSADFIVVDNLKDINVLRTYINGDLVYDGQVKIQSVSANKVNIFKAKITSPGDFKLSADGDKIRVIGVEDGSLWTKELVAKVNIKNGYVHSDTNEDILKIAVVNRYESSQPSIGFVKGFGIKEGAIASSVAHDSHNVVVVGTDDDMISRAVNLIVENKGGLSAVSSDINAVLPLPIAGLMSDMDANKTAKMYSSLNETAQKMGSKLQAPFMTLSFMALPVIPELKLSDKGLFSGKTFDFTDVFV